MPPDDVQEAIQSFRRNHLMELQARAPRGGRAAARAALRRGTPGPACCGVGASAWRRSASGHGAGPATRHRVATNPNPLCKAAARGRGGPDCARTGRRRCARTAGRRWGTALAAARWTRARTRRGRATTRRARPWRTWLCRRLVLSALGASGVRSRSWGAACACAVRRSVCDGGAADWLRNVVLGSGGLRCFDAVCRSTPAGFVRRTFRCNACCCWCAELCADLVSYYGQTGWLL